MPPPCATAPVLPPDAAPVDALPDPVRVADPDGLIPRFSRELLDASAAVSPACGKFFADCRALQDPDLAAAVVAGYRWGRDGLDGATASDVFVEAVTHMCLGSWTPVGGTP